MIITIKAPINILIYCDYDYSFICGYVIVITMTILIAIDTMYGVYTCICLCLSVYMSVVVIITVTNVDQWRTVNTTTTASTKISSITITTFFYHIQPHHANLWIHLRTEQRLVLLGWWDHFALHCVMISMTLLYQLHLEPCGYVGLKVFGCPRMFCLIVQVRFSAIYWIIDLVSFGVIKLKCRISKRKSPMFFLYSAERFYVLCFSMWYLLAVWPE